ncbi:hypothetical protein DRQ18_02380 [bacterium]|nr:MAG: hypothetical protein DRQ18_02380 [bacterium]
MKPKVGFYELTGCAGDMLNMLNCEDQLLSLFDVVEVKSFAMASSAHDEDTELDIAFVEGSVSTEENLHLLKRVREKSKILVAVGHCAIFGGVQISENNWEERLKKVYGDVNFIHTRPIPHEPLGMFVRVDAVIPGCPINKHQFLSAAGKLLLGTMPELYNFAVCAECKWKENECLLMKGKICLGPITRGGCGAICPTHNIPCIGCFGPVEEENVSSEYKLLLEKGYSPEELRNRMKIFGGKVREVK